MGPSTLEPSEEYGTVKRFSLTLAFCCWYSDEYVGKNKLYYGIGPSTLMTSEEYN